MAEPQLENQRLDRTRTWIRKVYRDTLITETITTFIMLCWKYDNSELAIYVLLSFLNCICIRTWDGDTKYKVMGLIGIVIQVYGSSRVFDTKEWNILSLFCLILVMFNFWIPVCRFVQVFIMACLVGLLKLITIALYYCINAPSPVRVNNNVIALRRMLTHIRTSNETCSVCLDEFAVGEESRRLPCNHVFHPTCIDRWVASGHDTCPNCRANVIMQPQPQEQEAAV
jgi:hypothetical protein